MIMTVLALPAGLMGCGRGVDVLSQEPVIPLVDHEGFSSLHVSGERMDEEPAGTVNAGASYEGSPSGEHTSGEGESDKGEQTVREEGPDDGEQTAAGGASGKDTAGNGNRSGGNEIYELEGTQLGDEQLVKMSVYFNLSSVNPYLCQEYDIPQDYDEEKVTDEVYITCVAGSYDTNKLYSIFYKKSGDDGLWNVVLRSDGDDYRFHSNRRCAD